jgi:hypothetical protein
MVKVTKTRICKSKINGRKNTAPDTKKIKSIPKISYRTCIRLSLIFALTSAGLARLGIGSEMMILIWINGVAIGILVLLLVINDLSK